jgi:hypothetical protein
MKMRILGWLFGKRESENKEKEKQKNETQDKYEKMPDLKRIFSSLPNIVKPTNIKSEDLKMQHSPSIQDRADAKSAAEKETKMAVSKNKVDDVYARIETAKSKNLEIVWLLHTNEDIPFKSLSQLMKNYRNIQASDSIKRISVNYVSEGRLREISPLDEQDIEGLVKKLKC